MSYHSELDLLKKSGVLDAPEDTEWVAYIDESGCTGMNFDAGSSKYLVYGIVLVHKKDISATRQIINKTRNHFSLPVSKVRELKFQKSKHNQRLFVLQELVNDSKVKIGYLLYRKHAINSQTHLYQDLDARYNFPLKLIVQNINRVLGNKRNLEVHIDGRDIVRNKAVEQYLRSRRYLEDDTCHFTNLQFGDSSTERNLQLADFVAGSIYQNYEHEKDAYKNLIFNHCFMKHVFPFGRAKKKLPASQIVIP